jgi:predicted phosphate transport protein (TIGR00153 family)|tara:strand:- start:1596 stop:2237 length:642 start_codon:yes stop_codon:yes gene_type:complete
MSFYKNDQKELINSINLFLNNILEVNSLFENLMKEFFLKNYKKVEDLTLKISDLESACDKLRRTTERKIYQETLIPEQRGDVLGMLENLDKIPGQLQGNAHRINTEKPDIHKELHDDFNNLVQNNSTCVKLLISGSKQFFIDPKKTIEDCLLVSKHESTGDKISTKLKNAIFNNNNLDLSQKMHLRYFVEIVDEVANLAEDVADRLIISSVKN